MKKYFGYTAVVLMAAMTMVGCGKNSDSQPAAIAAPGIVGPYGFANCAGCASNTQQIAQATSQNQQLGEALQLQFFGTAGATYQQYSGSQYGQVAAQGILHIGQYGVQCGMPPGDYQVSTQGAPAVMQGAIINNMQMAGAGPVPVVMQINRIYFTSPTTFQANGVFYGQNAVQQPCQFAYY